MSVLLLEFMISSHVKVSKNKNIINFGIHSSDHRMNSIYLFVQSLNILQLSCLFNAVEAYDFVNISLRQTIILDYHF